MNLSRLKTALSVFFIALFLAGCVSGSVKEPQVAGSFYPADREQLAGMVDGFLRDASPPAKPAGRIFAIVSPHAGLSYSGHVAAWGYKFISSEKIRTVIIVGQAHNWRGKGISVYPSGAFRTPLGDIPVDEALAKQFLSKEALVSFQPEAFDREHGIETQLPFLQRALPEKSVKIVPILFGELTNESFQHIKKVMTETMESREDVIVVASTDLSHYHPREQALRMDTELIEAMKGLSSQKVSELLMTGTCETCGAYPLILSMEVARTLGANMAVPLKYADSGESTGDITSVVGYVSMAIMHSAGTLTPEERAEILSIARSAVQEYVKTGKAPELSTTNEKLLAPGAAFVTINMKGNLRGCIGDITPAMPLYRSVAKSAISASSMDPRFPPMNTQELSDMEVEVSVLSPLKPVASFDEIEIGRHGLYLVKGQNSAVLLPQVPLEFDWDIEEYLGHLCEKAGLPLRNCLDGAALYSFTAEVIK